jgi:hypothetical protein
VAIFVALIEAEIIIERFVSDDFIFILVITDLKSRVSENDLDGMIDVQLSGFKATMGKSVRGCKLGLGMKES